MRRIVYLYKYAIRELGIIDKNRKTNKFYEWEEAVEYLREKYNDNILQLSKAERKKMELMYYRQGVVRAQKIKNKKERKKYLKKIFSVEPNFKNFVKYILNYTKS